MSMRAAFVVTALHWLLLRLAVLPWVLMVAGFALALALVVWADKLRPEAPPTNCWTWAGQEWWRRMRAWKGQGMPVGHEPYFVWRWSRERPRQATHALVGEMDTESGLMGLESYKPDDAGQFPLWHFWRWGELFAFKGGVRQGDDS